MNNNDWIISRLGELIQEREVSRENEPENGIVFDKDIQALEAAIEILKSCEPVKHANWAICCEGYYPFCSACGEEPPGLEMSRYCPNCGRRMVTPERRKA